MKKKIKLLPEQYWEWRTAVAEMQVAKERLRWADSDSRLALKEVELARFKADQRLAFARDAVESSERHYQELRKSLEATLNCSLANKVIDDVTFEIKELPDEKEVG